MKPETEELAKRLSAEPLLDDFLLVGGTALSVLLQHRLSEDLDFATAESVLPTKAISDLLERLQAAGMIVEDAMPMAARHEAINEGYDIEKYQQDWLVDGTKLTFFTLGRENGRDKLASDRGTKWRGYLRLASLDTLFVTKALVLTNRHAIRDNFDMHTLMAKGYYSYDDLLQAYHTYSPGTSLEIPKSRLLSKNYPLTDPGLRELIEESEAKIVERIHQYFSDVISNHHHNTEVQQTSSRHRF